MKRINKQYKENTIDIFDSLKLKNNDNNFNEIINIEPIQYQNDNIKMIIPTIFNLVQNLEKNKDKINLKLICTYNLLTLSEKFMGIEYMEYVIKKNEKEKIKEMQRDERKFMKNIFVIKKYFTKLGESFNYFFFKDLKLKIDNLLYYTILKHKEILIYLHALDVKVN